ncbi:LysM peptidoglycan-binding domain-containing protein [Blastococcus deserti]|uniref:LysM peptidoglycan-binding domain-containing protein n=1 Tax=Blastococcus deserti TaxID=2259033 RepID=A0ABW4XEK2_9ACTN
MGCVRQAVLEFDEEIQVPWRPRLVSVPDAGDAGPARRPPVSRSRRSPSRVGVCRPTVPPVVPAGRAREVVAPPGGHAIAAGSPSAGRPPARRHPGPGPAPAGAVRLTRRARRLAVVLAVAAGVALGSWLGPLLNGGAEGLRLAGESSVVVRPGDTLWSIASSVAGGADVRAVVDEIQQLNGLDGTQLLPGQALVLP